MSRFSDIRRAEENLKKLNKLREWEELSLADKKNKYRTNATIRNNGKKTGRSSKKFWVMPFGFEKELSLYCEGTYPVTKTELRNFEEAGAALIKELVDKLVGTGANPVGIYGKAAKPNTAMDIIFSPSQNVIATVTLIELTNTFVEDHKSRITNAPYTYRKKNSISSKFGQKHAEEGTDTFEAIASELETALGGDPTIRRLYFKPQKPIPIELIEK